MKSSQTKIFGIGLSKTGTSSLARALDILGYRTRDYLGVTRYSPGDLSSIDLAVLDTNDAFTDTPIPSFYRELDTHYPGSKFILTVRDTDGWLQSCKKQFNQKLADKLNKASNQLFIDLYGCTVFDEQMFMRGYANFTSGVYQYFKNRPQDLLVMDIAAGDGWEKLCAFLNAPIPDIPFPRANVTQIRWLDINEIIAIAHQAGNEILKAHKIILANGARQGTQKADRHGIAKHVFGQIRYALLGGTTGIEQTVIKKVEKILARKLKDINPSIPVISRLSYSTPYRERRKWNHFWLVDPLDSNTGLLAPDEDFTINIALIEDRTPVLGIVYAPAKKITYYTTTGKNAIRITAGGERETIDIPATSTQKLPPQIEQDEMLEGALLEYEPQPASKALSMCLAAEGKIVYTISLTNTMEWETAGAHAVIKSAGITAINCDTDSELTYNKEDLLTNTIIIK